MVQRDQYPGNHENASSAPDSQPVEAPRRVRMQFGLRLLLIATGLVCVAAAVLGGLWRGGADRKWFVILGPAAPLGVMVLLGVGTQIVRFFQRRRSR